MSSFCCSHFFSKTTCKLGIILTRTVNILTSDELVKLTMLWTTGPWYLVYHIYLKYLDTLSTYHTSPKIWNSSFYEYYLLMCLKYCCIYGKQCRPSSEISHSMASDLGLHCLQRPVCCGIWGYYSMVKQISVFFIVKKNTSCCVVFCNH